MQKSALPRNRAGPKPSHPTKGEWREMAGDAKHTTGCKEVFLWLLIGYKMYYNTKHIKCATRVSR